MAKFIASLKASTYVRQIATLVSGAFAAQLIMLLMMPVITRLYAPEEFGAYSLFISVISIFGLISSLKYDQAIMLPKANNNALALLTLALSIIIVVFLLAAIVVSVFTEQITSYFDGNEYLVYMIPLGILLIGLVQVLTSYSSRHRFYKRIAGARISNSISIVSIQAGSRWLLNLNGLVVGRLIADSLTVLILIGKHAREKTLDFASVSRRRMRLNAIRYGNFPKFQSMSVFLNAISQNMPVILLGAFYSPAIAGFYALSERLLRAPVGLIGASTKEVYYQAASRKFARGEGFLDLYTKTTIGLIKLIILPFLVILLFGEPLFEFVFGEEWSASGIISQILILWVLFLFINSPTMVTFNILHLQKEALLLEIVSVSLRFLSLYVGYAVFDSYYMSVSFYVAISVMANIFAILFIYYKLKMLRVD